MKIIAIFLKCKKKNKIRKKDTKNIRQTLKVRISVMAGQIQLKFEMECVLPQGTFHSKNGAVLFWHYWVTDMWKQHFCDSYIIHTCLSRVHTGRTIVCLDYILWSVLLILSLSNLHELIYQDIEQLQWQNYDCEPSSK